MVPLRRLTPTHLTYYNTLSLVSLSQFVNGNLVEPGSSIDAELGWTMPRRCSQLLARPFAKHKAVVLKSIVRLADYNPRLFPWLSDPFCISSVDNGNKSYAVTPDQLLLNPGGPAQFVAEKENNGSVCSSLLVSPVFVLR